MTAGLDVRRRQAPAALRVTRVEARRGAAPILAAAVALTGIVLLFVHPDQWVGRWQPFAAYLRGNLILVVPLCAAVATWQGGRERRRGTADQLAGSSRAGWRVLLAGSAALLVAACAGLLVTFLVGCAFVVPHASYTGGGWWWVLAGCLPPVSAALMLGLAVGRWVPLRVAGLVVAVTLYVVQAVPDYLSGNSGITWLTPETDSVNSGYTLLANTTLLQTLWFVGLTVFCLALAASRSAPATAPGTVLVAALVGLALTLSGAVTLLEGPGDRWVPDRAATRPVCSHAFPRVCLGAVDAYLLDDVAPRADAVLDRLAGVPGGPVRAAGLVPDGTDPAGALVLADLVPDLHGRLAAKSRIHADPIESAVQNSLHDSACDSGTNFEAGFGTRMVIEQIAAAWILQSWPDPPDEKAAAGLSALNRLTPAGQRTWIGRVYALRDRCDAARSAKLLDSLGTSS